MSNVITKDTGSEINDVARDAIGRLITASAYSIDNDLLESWPLNFKENATYKILTKADFDLGRKVGIWFCDSQGMLIDRISSIRSVNVFEPHVYRHILGAIVISEVKDGKYKAETNYVVIRTMYDGDMAVFSAGRYLDEIVIEDGGALFQSRLVITDSVRYDTMVVLPI